MRPRISRSADASKISFRNVLRLRVLTLLKTPFVGLVLIIGMGSDSGQGAKVTLVTLGPTGTCHERAAIEYMAFQGVDDFEIEFIGDFFDGLEKIRGRDD